MQHIDKERPYGEFIGGPVIGERICTYEGVDGQMVILVDHPGDDLFVFMYAIELEIQMKRAGTAKYIPPKSEPVTY